MLLYVISIISDILIFIILNIVMYTDRALMPNGETREWHRSPIGRLHAADQDWMLYMQILLAAVSIIGSILTLFDVKNKIVKKVQLISTIASVIMFIIIMIATANINVKYT